MTIMVDNKLLYPAGAKSAQVPVTATEWTDYTFPIITSNANQKHIVGISYSNDFSNSVCDRNLHIDKLVFNEKG